jgi:uncharacterized membrane protein
VSHLNILSVLGVALEHCHLILLSSSLWKNAAGTSILKMEVTMSSEHSVSHNLE